MSSISNKNAMPMIGLGSFAKATELKSRILFAIVILVVYRFGTFIPIPGINPVAMADIVAQNSEGILGVFNMFSGGAFGRMSIFALAIMPYITASIVMQLMTVMVKQLEELKKEGENGRRIITQYTRYLTIIITIFQGYAVAISIEGMTSSSGINAVVAPGALFRISTIITLTGGTILLMWLGEQITSRGIGNGISLIIFAGIVAELPSALSGTLIMAKTDQLSSLMVVTFLLIALSLIAFIVFVERSTRQVIVQYPKRQKGNKIFGGEKSHIPLKINTAGVIPPIFASAILLFPITLVDYRSTLSNDSSGDGGIFEVLSTYLSHGSVTYIVMYVLTIVFFSFFYTSIIFNSKETSENLRKNGGFIPGIRPGKKTEDYFDYILTRLTVIGALYLSFVCVVPELLIVKYSVPFYLGGTSLLIVVNVVIDTVTQIQSYLFAHQYEGLLKKTNIKGKRK